MATYVLAGGITVHSVQFRKLRDDRLLEVTITTNRLVIRLEKVGVALYWLVVNSIHCTACSFSAH